MRKITISVSVFALVCVFLLAKNTENVVQFTTMFKTATEPLGRVMSNISNWGYWIFQDGTSAHKPDGSSGGIYPKGTAATIYQDGFMWGGKVKVLEAGGDTTEHIRVGGQCYRIGTAAGWIETAGTPVAAFDTSGVTDAVASDASDPRIGIYRIRSDWESLTREDVKQDAADIYEISLGSVTDDDCDSILAYYEYAWNNWPTELGAPYYDLDNDGVYEPADGETPGIANADQIIWMVLHDLDASRTTYMYGSPPIGIETQITIWGYNQPDATLGQILFKKYKIINKSGVDITDMYVAQWSDPDVGTYTDDLSGCDVERSLGFAYTGFTTDDDFAAFNLPPGCVGYDFFQGPIVPGEATDVAIFDLKKKVGYKNLPMTSFGYFAAGSAITDPDQGVYTGTLQWYNLLKGYTPTDNIDSPTPYTHGSGALAGESTLFPLDGDPFRVTGDLDAFGTNLPAGDRRIVLASGPFTMANGDTQEVVVAVVGGIVAQAGGNNRNAVEQMKLNDDYAQFIYNNLFLGIPKPPKKPVVTQTPLEDGVILNWGSDPVAYGETEASDPLLGFNFQGYNVYQLPSATATKSQAVRVATYDVIDNITTIRAKQFLPDYGDIAEVPIQKGTDTGIKRFIAINKDYINDKPLYPGSVYYFAVTAYNFNADPTIPEPSLESATVPITVMVQPTIPGTEYGAEHLGDIEVTHTGTAGGDVTATVIDPASLTGHDYKLFFDQQHYYMDVDGKWKFTNYPDSVGKYLGKFMDVSPSTVTGIAYTSPTAGTRDLKFILDLVSPDYDYAEGVKLTFPSEITIKSATPPGGITALIDGVSNSVLFGNEVVDLTDLTGAGAFTGGELMTVNVSTPPTMPLDVEYVVYDDGWAYLFCQDSANWETCEAYGIMDAVVVNAEGTCTISEEAYSFKTIKHWNLKDVTTSEVILEDQYVINGTALDHITDGVFYASGNVGVYDVAVSDGFQLNLNVGYDAPLDFTGVDQTFADGSTTYRPMWHMDYFYSNDMITAIPYVILSYMQHGWSGGDGTAASIDAYGFGTTDVNYLQRDYELRFTGEYGDAIGNYHPIKDGTGSLAILYGARGYDITDHPDPNNPGDGSAFFIRIPFEVWDMEDPAGPRQVSILIYDRMGDPTATDFYAFNPDDRMYCEFLMAPYDEVIAGVAGDYVESNMLTWNTVWWNTQWTKGDVLHFIYDNPIQLGGDEFTFLTTPPTEGETELAKADVEKINVFPNPYYAYNPQSVNRFDRYITFSHLPGVSLTPTIIRIFNLVGVQVRKLETIDDTQYLQWDLNNEAGLPVGSGLYIAYVDMPDLDKEKVLKVFIIQREQILKYY